MKVENDDITATLLSMQRSHKESMEMMPIPQTQQAEEVCGEWLVECNVVSNGVRQAPIKSPVFQGSQVSTIAS